VEIFAVKLTFFNGFFMTRKEFEAGVLFWTSLWELKAFSYPLAGGEGTFCLLSKNTTFEAYP